MSPARKGPRFAPFDAARADQLLAYVQAGAFPQIAALACGIRRETFEAWVERGRRPKGHRALRQFVARLDAAAATARLLAEVAVHADDPKYWLKFGPGRDRPGEPGWAREVKPFLEDRSTTVNVLANPLISDLLTVILAALAPFPEARVAAAAAINRLAVDTKPPPKLVAALPAATAATPPRPDQPPPGPLDLS